MGNDQWLESVYSDGSRYFVSNPEPKLGERVSVRIRMYEDTPVRHVLVRTCPSGNQYFSEAGKIKTEHGLAYYEASFVVSEPRMHYHFYLACDNIIYYYMKKASAWTFTEGTLRA